MKKWMSRILVLALSTSMILGLSSCGKKGMDKADNELAKQNVYRGQALELPELGDEINISSTKYINDRLYVVANVYHWSTGDPDETVLFSMKADGSDIQTLELEMPEPKHREDVETGADSGESEGNAGAVPMPLPMPRTGESVVTETKVVADAAAADIMILDAPVVDTDIAVDEEWVDPGYYEQTFYSYYEFAGDNRLYGIENYYYENYSDPANYIWENEYSLVCWDLDGKLLWKLPLEMDKKGDYLSIDNMITTQDGSVYIVFNSEKYMVLEVSADGQPGTEKELNIENGWIERSAGSYKTKDGRWILTFYDEEYSFLQAVVCDLKNGSMTEAVKMPANLWSSGWDCIAPGESQDLVFSNNRGIYGFNIGDEEAVKIMDFVNSDLMVGSMRNLIMLSDGRIICIYDDSSYANMEAGIFTAVAPEEIADKRILTLAGIYMSGDLRADVIAFNKNNTEYRIIMKDYSEYNTESDYTVGRTRLNNDIITGNMPDILYVGSDLTAETYISKGLAVDIGELLEKDEELSKDMFLDNIMEAYSMDGKLYQVVPKFYIRTYLTHAGIVGDIDEMTFSKLEELKKKLPDAKVFSFATQESFIYDMMSFAGSDFVNPGEGVCNFTNADFIEMLKFAKDLPKEIVYDDDYFMTFNYDTQYMEGKTLLCDGYISDFRMNYVINGYLEGQVNYSGFPAAEGSRSVIQASDSYMISAKSDNIDGAWQFLRKYLTKEYQEKMNYGLPTNKEAFDEMSKLALQRPFYQDENGNKIEYDETIYLNGEERKIDPLSQAQLDELIAFIKSVKELSYYDTDIQNIIVEEAAPFFSGQKSAEEVAAIIQNRVQLFVDENS